jgi:hypothetical protein
MHTHLRCAVPLPCLLLTTLWLVGCGGPSGACTGRVGASNIDGELGGETSLVIDGSAEQGRTAQLVLDYGDLLVDTEVQLPAGQALTQVPFGPDEPPRPAELGQVTRFIISEPPGAAAVRTGTLTVRFDAEEHLIGVLSVALEDGTSVLCNFDVEDGS